MDRRNFIAAAAALPILNIAKAENVVVETTPSELPDINIISGNIEQMQGRQSRDYFIVPHHWISWHNHVSLTDGEVERVFGNTEYFESFMYHYINGMKVYRLIATRSIKVYLPEHLAIDDTLYLIWGIVNLTETVDSSYFNGQNQPAFEDQPRLDRRFNIYKSQESHKKYPPTHDTQLSANDCWLQKIQQYIAQEEAKNA